MLDLPSPIAVACHDAGAANIIFAWLAASGAPREIRPAVAGPAERLWLQRFGSGPTPMPLAEALDGAVALLSGTGWASHLEHVARKMARDRRIFSVGVIDHWVNYSARFVRAGETVWPDEFWVTDEHALREARRTFPGACIRLQPNLYLEEQVARIRPLQPGMDNDVLYVAEPARSDWGRDTPGEFQALDYFFDHLEALGISKAARFRLRPHPSDPSGKYDEWLAGRDFPNLALDASPDLAEAIASASWVVGAQSFALVVALAAGRKVVCALPPWAPKCALPHSGLIHLQALC